MEGKKTLVVVSFIALVIAGVFNQLYIHWKFTVDPTDGFNIVDSLIGAGGLLLNAVTIYFVLITYQQQNKQIEEQRKYSDFSRTSELLQKNLEYVKRNFEEDYKEMRLALISKKIHHIDFASITFDLAFDLINEPKGDERFEKNYIRLVGRLRQFTNQLEGLLKFPITLVYGKNFDKKDIVMLSYLVRTIIFNDIINFYRNFTPLLLDIDRHRPIFIKFYQGNDKTEEFAIDMYNKLIRDTNYQIERTQFISQLFATEYKEDFQRVVKRIREHYKVVEIDE